MFVFTIELRIDGVFLGYRLLFIEQVFNRDTKYFCNLGQLLRRWTRRVLVLQFPYVAFAGAGEFGEFVER